MQFSIAIRALLLVSFTAKAVSAQHACNADTAGDECVVSAYDAASGCTSPGTTGYCMLLVSGDYGCMATWDTPTTLTQSACERVGCDCYGSLCVAAGCHDPCGTVFCEVDLDCDVAGGEICDSGVCENRTSPGATGDPHMTGFRGQKFDFVGEDGEWYCVVEDSPALQLNMRVTSPVPSVPEITYITGISIMATDAEGLEHTILIQVTDPHSLDSSCPVGLSPCLANGALTVEVDGREVLLAPGTVSVGPDVAIAAVNLPGACRSFGFEKYWEHKKAEYAQAGRMLGLVGEMEDMARWILGDPTVTNMAECEEYVTRAAVGGDSGLFAHESEHTSFQIMTPLGVIRLSHGKLHQLPMRDPTDLFDLPEHLTWQMNVAIDHSSVSTQASGILGETLVPTVDGNGKPIMQGMEAIRGNEEDYRVKGPFDTIFAQGKHRE